MSSRLLKTAIPALMSSALLVALAGCCAPEKCAPVKTTVKTPCGNPCDYPVAFTSDMPRNPVPGECYAKVFIAPRTKTVRERVCIREASERLEVVPAEYEWVEERVCVKEASTRLEIVPAEYATREKTV